MTKSIAVALSALVVLAATACNPNEALKPKDPGIVTTLGPQQLPAVYAGAISDFQVAWTGGGDATNGAHEGNVGLSSIFTDEMTTAGLDIFTFRNDLDVRHATPANSQLYGIFNDLSSARVAAEQAMAAFAKFRPTDIGRAEVTNLAGYTYIVFAENWCTGIPFSTLDITTGKLTFGQPIPTDSVLRRAISKFDSAAMFAQTPDTQSTTPISQEDPNDMLAVALLGKARALLDLGEYDSAGTFADSALGMSPSLNYLIENSANSPRQYNGMWQYSQFNFAFGIPIFAKDGNGLPFREASDPRVLWLDARSLGAVGGDSIYFQMKYPQKFSSGTLAGFTEATLISAERDLHDNLVGSWATKLNALRTSSGLTDTSRDENGVPQRDGSGHIITQPMPTLTADSTTTASSDMRIEVHFRERAFWLWLTGSRLGDLRRLRNQYGHDDFPAVGPGDNPNPDFRFPVPLEENNNPHYQGCGDAGNEQ
jgi:starch-binding outer membrane protein, SusD/RagB family